MTVFQNELIAFRCPKSFKDKITEHAHENGLHLSQFIRKACSKEINDIKKDRDIKNTDAIKHSFIKNKTRLLPGH